jgi:G:T-mismatch repair DNA endonuclease (very short patch repair protein)
MLNEGRKRANHLKALDRINKDRAVKKEEALSRFRSRHGDKFEYNFDTYKGFNYKMEIICPKHGSFWVSGKDHAGGAHGCKLCSVNAKSRQEQEWLNLFGDSIIRQHRVRLEGKVAIVDGFNQDTNTIYEYLGDYWHGHPKWHDKFGGINATAKIEFLKLFNDTEKRLKELLNLGYNIVYVWENDIEENITNQRLFEGKLKS